MPKAVFWDRTAMFVLNKLLSHKDIGEIFIDREKFDTEYPSKTELTSYNKNNIEHQVYWLVKNKFSELYDIKETVLVKEKNKNGRLIKSGIYIKFEPFEIEQENSWIKDLKENMKFDNSNVACIENMNIVDFEEREIQIIDFSWGKNSNLIISCIDVLTNIKFFFSVFSNKKYSSDDGSFNFKEFKDGYYGEFDLLICSFKKQNSGYLRCISARLKTE